MGWTPACIGHTVMYQLYTLWKDARMKYIYMLEICPYAIEALCVSSYANDRAWAGSTRVNTIHWIQVYVYASWNRIIGVCEMDLVATYMYNRRHFPQNTTSLRSLRFVVKTAPWLLTVSTTILTPLLANSCLYYRF